MRGPPRRHLPPEFVAAQRLREAGNVMLQVPPPTPKQRMARSRTLGDDGGRLLAAGPLPADAAAAGCGGGSWTAAGSLWSLLRRDGHAGRGGAEGGAGAAAARAAGGPGAGGAADAAGAGTDAGEGAVRSASVAPGAEGVRERGVALHMSGGPGAAGSAADTGAGAGRGVRSAAGAAQDGVNRAGEAAGWAGEAARGARGGASVGESAFAKASGGAGGVRDGDDAQADSVAPRRVSFAA
jgi:hypothetical protein